MIEFDESANYGASSNLGDGERWDGFTKRERACIDLLYPDSGLGWLNEIIQFRRREEMAKFVMTAIFDNIEWIPVEEAAPPDGLTLYKDAIADSYMVADFALSESDKK